MVYEPGKRKGPSVVKDSYILTTAADASFFDMVKEVEGLIKKEGKEGEFQIKNKMTAIGLVFIHCDADFAEKLKHLPYVGSVEQEHIAYAQKKRPGGPGIAM
jgi:hypothetical protein